jgi:hypothetical protein
MNEYNILNTCVVELWNQVGKCRYAYQIETLLPTLLTFMSKMYPLN